MSAALYIFVSIHHLIVGGRGLKGKKWPKMTKKIVSFCISGTVPYMIVVFGTHV